MGSVLGDHDIEPPERVWLGAHRKGSTEVRIAQRALYKSDEVGFIGGQGHTISLREQLHPRGTDFPRSSYGEAPMPETGAVQRQVETGDPIEQDPDPWVSQEQGDCGEDRHPAEARMRRNSWVQPPAARQEPGSRRCGTMRRSWRSLLRTTPSSPGSSGGGPRLTGGRSATSSSRTGRSSTPSVSRIRTPQPTGPERPLREYLPARSPRARTPGRWPPRARRF